MIHSGKVSCPSRVQVEALLSGVWEKGPSLQAGWGQGCAPLCVRMQTVAAQPPAGQEANSV